MKTSISIFLISMFFVGCSTPYQSSGLMGGFTDTQLAPDVFRVTFRGNAYTSGERAQDLALLRAADLTLQSGHAYFAIVNESNATTASSFTTPGQTTTTGNVTAAGNSAYYSENTTTMPGQTYTFFRPSSGMLIRCFTTKPEGIFTFDAAFLQHSIKQKYNIE
jgi:hypothetical protein